VPHEFARITTTGDGKQILDDGTVIAAWLYRKKPDA
jgi:hypothetical protein